MPKEVDPRPDIEPHQKDEGFQRPQTGAEVMFMIDSLTDTRNLPTPTPLLLMHTPSIDLSKQLWSEMLIRRKEN